MTEIETNACYDAPSSTDYQNVAVFGNVAAATPEAYALPLPEIQNQGAHPVTAMACTRFGISHGGNSQNLYVSEVTDREYVASSGYDMWLRYIAENPSAEINGATLQSGMKQAKSEGLISGYTVLSTIYEIEDSIVNERPVYTGSQVGDWLKVTTEHVYGVRTDGRLVGHAFVIIGYDRALRVFYAINSYGPSNGVFKIPYDLVDTLFTRYSLIDIMDIDYILNYRRRIMEDIKIEDAKKAFEEGIWNGLNPQNPASREEVSAMIYRAISKLQS